MKITIIFPVSDTGCMKWKEAEPVQTPTQIRSIDLGFPRGVSSGEQSEVEINPRHVSRHVLQRLGVLFCTILRIVFGY
jgi:hypothetical protein